MVHANMVLPKRAYLNLSVVAIVVVLARPGVAQDLVLPVSPLSPTFADCNVLSQDFYHIRRGLFDQRRECASQPPDFGVASVCGGRPQTHAFIQCIAIDEQICAVGAAARQEVQTCQERAQGMQQEQRLAQLTEANDRYDQAMDILRFVQDPLAYLGQMFSPFPDTLDLIYGPDRDQFDTSLAQEIYRYAHNQANAGHVTVNPIINSIQSEALAHLARLHAHTIADLNELAAAVARFDGEFQNNPRPQQASGSSGAAGGAGGGSDCMYNRERFEMYLDWCPNNDGCAMQGEMQSIVDQSCQ